MGFNSFGSFGLTIAPIVYSWNEGDHASHVRIVNQTLKDKELYDMFSECGFWLKYVAFLGHIFSGDGIRVDILNIEAFQICLDPNLQQI